MKGDPSKLPCPLCHRQRPPAPNIEVRTLSCRLGGCGFPLPSLAETVPDGVVELAPGGTLRVHILLLDPAEGPVITRIHRISGVPYQRVKPGERFMVELEVSGYG